MPTHTFRWLWIGVFLSSPAYAQGAGTTAAPFLSLGVSPRTMAMGDASTGLADDAYAANSNPAGLAQLEIKEFGVAHNEYLLGIREHYATYAHPTRLGTIAGSLTTLGVEKFQGYDATGQATHAVGAQDLSMGVSYGYAFRKDARMESLMALGVTGKWIRETLAEVSAQSFATDAGFLWSPGRRHGWLRGWKVGVALRNLGSPMRFDQKSFDLPRELRAGVSYSGLFLGETLTLVLDGRQPWAGDRSFGGGLEMWTLKTLALRAGYTSLISGGSGLRAGAGLRFRTVQVDYAFAGAGDLGNAHRLGLTFRFQSATPNTQTQGQDWYEKGLRQFHLKRWTEALVDFNRALEIDPEHPEALPMMRKTYERISPPTN